ncbi:MAG: DUF1631 family protein [Proteobacteria bacterium]|nr:DUF1631 family protein [Pseudomonadota bacterium]
MAKEEVKEVLILVKVAVSNSLAKLAMDGLEEANQEIVNRVAASGGGPSIHQEKAAIVQRFLDNLAENFDELLGIKTKEVNILSYGGLSLVDKEDLEAIIAMEGMVAHARNCDIQEYLSFTTRLDSMFSGTRIDESNNPLDPEQIGMAFKDAIKSVGLNSADLLLAYRKFNSCVFHQLEHVLAEANDILIEHGVIPNLGIAARNKRLQRNKRTKRRQKTDPAERAFATTEQNSAADEVVTEHILSVMQNLLHGTSEQGTGIAVIGQSVAGAGAAEPGQAPVGPQQGMMGGSQKVELVSIDQLVSYLGQIQATAGESTNTAGDVNSSSALNLGESIGELLQQGSTQKTLRAIDGQSSDIIHLVTLLYEAIWQDETVPIPVKELIGRTQITILKIALQDSNFFDSEIHPARVLINQLATAGISWTEYDKLEQDPMYCKMKQLVDDLISKYDGEIKFVETLIEEFKTFKREQLLAAQKSELRLQDADERQNRLDEVKYYAYKKITERVLDKGIHSFVKLFLITYFHKFVVHVVLREGPGGISWKPVMNTIDVLLWTVQDEKNDGDIERFEKVNPRLIMNLGKALEVTEIEKAKVNAVLETLQKVQRQCFKRSMGAVDATDSKSQLSDVEDAQVHPGVVHKQENLPDDDEHFQEVSKYQIGIWLEFLAEGEQTIRCTLAAIIHTIEKYVFVNAQGVKVIEKSKMGLARELKAGTVKVISEALLIDRAMESVIGKLRGVGLRAEAQDSQNENLATI